MCARFVLLSVCLFAAAAGAQGMPVQRIVKLAADGKIFGCKVVK